MTGSSAAAPTLDEATLRRLPKVLLHDHLDGGVRPATLVELAREQRSTTLPTADPAALARWFAQRPDRHDLVTYLESFAHTVAVMQERDAIERIAAECAEDLAADGVVYAEVRLAPELHTARGLSLDDVVDAVRAGLERGRRDHGITTGIICSAMRTADRSLDIARLAVRHREGGVVGFDIAGAEEGYPPAEHIEAFRYLHDAGMPATVHAGEAFGLPSIREAVEVCGATRLGHGVRLVDDLVAGVDDETMLGPVAAMVHRRHIALEVCVTSNVQTGVCASVLEHPIDRLAQLGFRVTVNTDNRLMSGCTLTSELAALVDAFGWDLDRIEHATVDAIDAAFAPPEVRAAIRWRVRDGFAAARRA